jgi:hypothetical protein
LRNDYFRALGKLSFEGALVCPIVIVILYCGQDYAIYLTNPGVLYLGCGNVLSVLASSLVIYLIVEHPLKRLVDLMIVKPFLSHDELLRRKYQPEKYVEVTRRSITYKKGKQ